MLPQPAFGSESLHAGGIEARFQIVRQRVVDHLQRAIRVKFARADEVFALEESGLKALSSFRGDASGRGGRRFSSAAATTRAQISLEKDQSNDETDQAAEVAGIVDVGDASESRSILHPDLFGVGGHGGPFRVRIEAKSAGVARTTRRENETKHDHESAQPGSKYLGWREMRHGNAREKPARDRADPPRREKTYFRDEYAHRPAEIRVMKLPEF